MKTIFKNRSILLLTILGVVAIFISSCKKSDPTPIVYADASIRIVNAVAASSGQDFYQGDTKISTTAVTYGNASAGYYTVKGGPSTLLFKNTGTSTITSSSNVGIEEGKFYTVFNYTSASGSAEITGFKDDNTPPTTGKAKVRFVNLGFTFNNSLNVTYSGSGTLIVSNLGLGVSTYNNIDPNTDLGVAVIGSATTTVIPGSNFVAGKIYTVWFDAISATSANYHVVVQN